MFDFFKKKITGYENIAPEEFKGMMVEKEHIVLDVRTPQELVEGNIPHQVQIDFSDPSFESQISELDRTKTYLIYCRSGNRSAKACQVMEKMGFHKLYNLQGGLMAWKASGL